MSDQFRKVEKRKPSLGVILPTLNNEPSLGPVLRSLAEAACLFDMDVIVADGGSADGTVDIAQRHDARVLEAEGGWGAQVAAAAQMTWAQWVMLLGGDILPRAGWSSNLRQFIDTAGCHEFTAYGRFQDKEPRPFLFMRRLSASQSGLVLRRSQLEGLFNRIRPVLLSECTIFDHLDRRRTVQLPYLLQKPDPVAADAA